MIVPVPRSLAWVILLLSISLMLTVLAVDGLSRWGKSNAEALLDARDRGSVRLSAKVIDDRREVWRDDHRWTVHLQIDKQGLWPNLIKIPSQTMFVAKGDVSCEFRTDGEQTITLLFSSSYRLNTLTYPKGCGVRIA